MSYENTELEVVLDYSISVHWEGRRKQAEMEIAMKQFFFSLEFSLNTSVHKHSSAKVIMWGF